MRTIDAGMDEYVNATAPDILGSGGLGPCISIGAIYGERGYMVHYIPLQRFDEVPCINEFFRALKMEAKDKSKLKIYVAGGQIVSEQEDEDKILEYLVQGRQTVLDKITEQGYKIGGLRWCPVGVGQVLTLNLSKGRAIYEEF